MRTGPQFLPAKEIPRPPQAANEGIQGVPPFAAPPVARPGESPAIRDARLLSRICLVAGFGVLWASIVIIPVGTELQTQSPRFPEYEQHVNARVAAANPGSDVGPGLLFAFAWPLTALFCVFIGGL